MEVTSLVIGNLHLTSVESNRDSGINGSNTSNFDGLLSLVQHQPNYIKRLFGEVVNKNISSGKIVHDYIIAEEAEINIKNLRKATR